ncbi:MAG: GIY-YIG nuclease family protein [bacterium]
MPTDTASPPPSTIKVFLADGVPEGLWIVTKQNWTGIALRFSRNTYKDVRARQEFGRPGVYVLAGDPATSEHQREIYVGEAGAVRDRLNNHLSGQDFWTEAVVFVAADDFNVSHAKYLEAQLLGRAKEAKRCVLKNNQPMLGPTLGEAEAADMETFLAEMLVVYPILGVSAFEMPKKLSSERLLLSGIDTSAKGQRTAEGFLVFAGATARKEMVESAQAYQKMVALREELLENKVLVEDGDKLVLTQDYVFSAPSLAAALLLGRPANGLTEWKTESGKTLKDLESEEAAA